ncbi:MAG: glycosyltransferase family 39 protein [Acidobacteria bacterium]|nr:glycosyltransferase family 39 protein [Acidobacteriota bacterium]
MAPRLRLCLIPVGGALAATNPDRLLGFVPDDAFYYFGVAEHVRDGWWFSFDGPTRTNGFHPLWALVITPVLAVAGHTFAYVLMAGAILTALAIAVLARCVEHLWDARVAVAFSVLMALNPIVLTHAVNGLETGLLMFTTSLLLWQGFVRGVGSSHAAIRLGVITAAVCLSRTDAAFLAVLVWVGILIRHRGEPLATLRLLVRAGVVAALIMAPGSSTTSSCSAV